MTVSIDLAVNAYALHLHSLEATRDWLAYAGLRIPGPLLVAIVQAEEALLSVREDLVELVIDL
jgi:hypothetical protein